MTAIPEIAKLFKNKEFISYCDNKTTENSKEFMDSIESSLQKANSELSKIDTLEHFHIAYMVKLNDNTVDDIKLQISFKHIDSGYEKCVLHISRDGFEVFKSDIKAIIVAIIHGYKAINHVNNQIQKLQAENGSPVKISYKWSYTDKLCSIYDWDYDNIKVKLNKHAVNKLAKLDMESKLDYVYSMDIWNKSIKQFIEEFNTLNIHKNIGAVIESHGIEKILTENMLDTNDVIAVIRKNKDNKGTQNFKSVSVVRELGTFIAVCRWCVEYSKHEASIKIMGDKILDVENGRFIGDLDIYNRIEQRISISEQVKKLMFN